MADFKISGKNVITQSGTAEPVLASNVTLGTGIIKAANITAAASSTLSCTTDSTTTVATADTSSLSVGMAVSGTNIPANAHIVTIPNATSFTITSAATGGATSTLTFNTGITSAKIEDNAVTTAKLADDAVGLAALSATGTASTTTYLRGDNTWQTAGSTDASDLTSGTLPIARIADDAITGAKIAAGIYLTASATQNITGALPTTTNSCYLSQKFVVTGNITISGNMTLTKMSDDEVTTGFILDDGTSRTISGTGILTLGCLI